VVRRIHKNTSAIVVANSRFSKSKSSVALGERIESRTLAQSDAGRKWLFDAAGSGFVLAQTVATRLRPACAAFSRIHARLPNKQSADLSSAILP
jgi:hypothetical protein